MLPLGGCRVGRRARAAAAPSGRRRRCAGSSRPAPPEQGVLADRGVGVDGVQTAEPAQRPRHAALDRGLVRDVAPDRERRAPVLARRGRGPRPQARRCSPARPRSRPPRTRARSRRRAVAGARHEGDALRLVATDGVFRARSYRVTCDRVLTPPRRRARITSVRQPHGALRGALRGRPERPQSIRAQRPLVTELGIESSPTGKQRRAACWRPRIGVDGAHRAARSETSVVGAGRARAPRSFTALTAATMAHDFVVGGEHMAFCPSCRARPSCAGAASGARRPSYIDDLCRMARRLDDFDTAGFLPARAQRPAPRLSGTQTCSTSWHSS